MPRRIRVFIKDTHSGKQGEYYDMAIIVPWLDWMSQMILWRGILFDHGWLPIDAIKAIHPINNEGQADMTNVVPLKR